MRVKHLTHNDLDGIGCALLADYFLYDNATYEYECVANKDVDDRVRAALDEVDVNTFLLITDVAPSVEVAYEIQAKAKDIGMVRLLDHHATASGLKHFYWATVRSGRSATRLVYEMFTRTPPPMVGSERVYGAGNHRMLTEFVSAVDSYDLYRKDDVFYARGLPMRLLTEFLGMDSFFENYRLKFDFDYTNTGDYIVNALKSRQEAYIRQCLSEDAERFIFEDSKGRKFMVVFSEQHVSELCHQAMNKFPVDYVACVIPSLDVVSLRSRDGEVMDVSQLAKRLGGGGHVKAAGFPYPLKDALSAMFKALV